MSKIDLKYKVLKGIGIVGLSLKLLGCGPAPETRTEYSNTLYESAIVSDAVYIPSRHGSGSGIGPTMDFDGNIGISVTSVSVDIPEKYAIVFKCKHGKFISEGEDQRHKDLWKKLSEGDSVKVSYREIFSSYYEDKNNDDKLDLISRSLIGYDFLDAVRLNKNK